MSDYTPWEWSMDESGAGARVREIGTKTPIAEFRDMGHARDCVDAHNRELATLVRMWRANNDDWNTPQGKARRPAYVRQIEEALHHV